MAVKPSLERHMQVLAFVAHELGNPLMALRAAAALLSRASADESVRRHAQQVIERQVRQMSRLVGDLLDVSRAQTGKLRLVCQTVDLGALVGQAVDTCRPALNARAQQLAVDVQEGDYRLHGDPARLTQVVCNLLDNASKYTPVGGSVSIALSTTAEAIELTVSDTGIGIAPDALPMVFEPFTQHPDAVGYNHAGLGIGLALVRELVISHGGNVGAHSAGRGCGSRFVVMLPAGKSDALQRP